MLGFCTICYSTDLVSESHVYYPSRDQLLRNYNLHDYTLDVELQDLRNYDEALCDKLVKQPSEYLPLVRNFSQYNAYICLHTGYLHIWYHYFYRSKCTCHNLCHMFFPSSKRPQRRLQMNQPDHDLRVKKKFRIYK